MLKQNLKRVAVAGLLGALCLSAWAESSVSAVQKLWGQGFFKAPAAQVLSLVQATQFFPDKSVVVLFAQGDIHLTSQGTEVRTGRLVYRVQSQEAVNSWGGIQTSWSPWRQEKPTVRARVINRDGSVWNLDPSTLVVGQAGSDGEGVYSDQKTLQGPYPHVQVGSVIEEEVTSVFHPLLAGSGIFDRWNFGFSVPVLVEELKLEVARGLPFHLQTYGPQKFLWSENSTPESKFWQVTMTHLLPLKDPENNLPRDATLIPVAAFSTAPSWVKLSKLYGKLIDEKIQASPVSLPSGIAPHEDLASVAVKLMHWVNSQVRYVGLRLGQNSIIPYSPQEILHRGYGDCKDKAVLLTSLLRQAGYKASVALLWDGSNSDIFPQVPGLDQFDHAIVRVDAKTQLWLDPTSDYSRDTNLPPWDQERWALVTQVNGEGLLKTPLPVQQEVTETRLYTLEDFGRCDVQETTVYSGGFDVYFRQQYAFADPDETQKKMSKYAEDAYGGHLTSVTFSPPKDLDKPFTFTVNVDHSDRAWTGFYTSELQLKPAYLLTWIDSSLSDTKAPARIHPYRVEIPLLFHWKNIIRPPVGFVLRRLPLPVDKDYGEFHLHRRASVAADGTLTLEWTLSTPPGELTPIQFDQARKAFLADKETFAPLDVAFDLEAHKSLVDRHFRKAFDQYRATIAQNPKNAQAAARYSQALLAAGFTDRAIFWAERAVTLEPKSARLYAVLAWTLQYDTVGRHFGPGWPRQRSIAAYQKALALDPNDWNIRLNYALVLEYNAAGLRYTDPADLQLALQQYDRIKPELVEQGFDVNPIFELFHLGRWAEVLNRASQLSKPIPRWGFTLAVMVLQNGSSAALSQVANWGLDTSTLASTEELAAELLIQRGRYPEASAVLRQEALLSNDSSNLNQRADYFASLQRTAAVPKPFVQPEDFYLTFLQLLDASQGSDFTVFQKIMSPRLVTLLSNPLLTSGFPQIWSTVAQAAITTNMPLAFYRDSAFAQIKEKVQGSSEDGYHITLTGNHQNWDDGFFLVRSGQDLSAVAMTSEPFSLVEPLQKFLDQKKKSQAIQWLEWLFEDFHKTNTPLANLLQTLWDSPGSTSTKGIQTLIDALRASSPQTEKDVIPAMQDLTKLSGDQKASLAKVIALGIVSNHGLLPQASLVDELSHDTSAWGKDLYQGLLRRTGQFDELERSLKESLAKNPASQSARQSLLTFYLNRPDAKAAQRFITENNLKLTVHQDNDLAWAELFATRLAPQALETALEASSLKDRGALNTLAAVWAEFDRPDQAFRVFLESLGTSKPPLPADWYVLGRTAQTYGLFSVAETDYKKAETQTYETTSATILARRQLAQLALSEHRRQDKPE